MSLNHRGVINDGPSIDEMAWDHAGDGLENTALLNRERDELATTTTGGIHDFSRLVLESVTSFLYLCISFIFIYLSGVNEIVTTVIDSVPSR